MLVRISGEQSGLAEVDVAELSDTDRRVLLEQYAKAFENTEVEALMRVLKDDAVWEMPPFATWSAGRESIGRFLPRGCPHRVIAG